MQQPPTIVAPGDKPATVTGLIVYTLGYLGIPTFEKGTRKVDGLRHVLESHSAFLADIRIKPWSQAPCWRAASLAQEFGELYVGVPELGNRNYRGALGEGFHIADMDCGIAKVLDAAARLGKAPLLLCACDDFEGCHRRHVGLDMHQRGLVADVIEVHWKG